MSVARSRNDNSIDAKTWEKEGRTRQMEGKPGLLLRKPRVLCRRRRLFSCLNTKLARLQDDNLGRYVVDLGNQKSNQHIMSTFLDEGLLQAFVHEPEPLELNSNLATDEYITSALYAQLQRCGPSYHLGHCFRCWLSDRRHEDRLYLRPALSCCFFPCFTGARCPRRQPDSQPRLGSRHRHSDTSLRPTISYGSSQCLPRRSIRQQSTFAVCTADSPKPMEAASCCPKLASGMSASVWDRCDCCED